MADSGVARDRLPWLEPYRAPPRRKSNRRAGLAAAIGAIGLAGVVTLLTRDMIPFPTANEPVSEDSVILHVPADLQPQVILPPLQTSEPHVVETASVAPAPRKPVRTARRQITAVPTRAAYRQVVREQAEQLLAAPAMTENAVAIAAIAALPIAPEPRRPTVNPAARVVRGKTVQMGVYRTAGQAEAAWRSAVRDYTYLVTMPKSIEAISIRSKRFYRLQLGTPSKQHAKQLCGNLKSIGRACTVA
jgi:hypothetical protein